MLSYTGEIVKLTFPPPEGLTETNFLSRNNARLKEFHNMITLYKN